MISKEKLIHPATVLAALALLVAAGLPGVAADAAKKSFRAITGKQIKNGSIGKRDLAAPIRRKLSAPPVPGPAGPRGLAGARGAEGSEGPAGPLGNTGDQGDQGPTGVTGPTGSNGTNATVNGVTAGGDLTGTYPNPDLKTNSVGTAEVTQGSLNLGDLAGQMDGFFAINPPNVGAGDCRSLFHGYINRTPGSMFYFVDRANAPLPDGLVSIPVVVDQNGDVPMVVCNYTNADIDAGNAQVNGFFIDP